MTEKEDIENEKDITLTIRSQLSHAQKNHLKVNVFATGTFKGINGYISAMQHGSLTIRSETEDGEVYQTTLRILDIKRVSVFEK